MDTKIFKFRKTSIFLVCAAAIFQPVQAWKVSTHAASGNQMLDDFAATGRTPLDMSGTTTIQFTDPLTGRQLSLGVTKKDALVAIRNWPDYFRGGLIGPDGFPDMVTGQLLEHANQTPFIWKGLKQIKNKAPSSIKSYWTNYQIPDASLPTTVLEQRATPSQMRSIDFGMALFQHAKSYITPVSALTIGGGWSGPSLVGVTGSAFGIPQLVTKSISADEQQQILAFIIGYIGHCIGDGMGHTYINEYASGAWDYLEGQGLFGAETEEIKHVVVEGFIDKRVPGDLRSTTGVPGTDENRYTISIPVKFLDQYFSTRRATQNVGDRDGDVQEFLAAYTDIDQYYGGPFYSYFNMQVDAGDHIEDWANARGFLNVVETFDPFVSFLGAVDDIIESIPGWGTVQDFKNWAKGDLLEFLTFGKLNCSSPQNVDFFDVWKKLSSIRGNISKWKDHSEIVRHNWLMMSRCTAENLAKLNGGKNPLNGAVVYRDACAEMADAPWADEAPGNNKALYRGSIRVAAPATKLNDETADQEFLRETKEAFRGEEVNGQSFEKANQHRLTAANIERAYSYLLGVSITIDDLMEIFSVGSMQPTLDHYCGMAENRTESQQAHRLCFNVTKRGELALLLEAYCIYNGAIKTKNCITDMAKTWNRCKDDEDRKCRANPLAKISIPEVCVPRYCKRIFRKKFCVGGGCVGGGTYDNWVWLTPCYASVYPICAAYDIAVATTCEAGVLWDFAGCQLKMIDQAVFSKDPFSPFFNQLDQGCRAITEAKKDIAIYRSLDTKAERDTYLRERGVPVDEINELKRVWADVIDKIAGLPDVYMLNLVFLKEDLRDGQYVPIVRQQIAAARTRILNLNESDKAEAIALMDELEGLVNDIEANRNAFHLPFNTADMSSSISNLSDPTTRTSLQTRLAAMEQLVQEGKANPRQSDLVQRIEAEVALLESIDLKSAGAFSSEGAEQRDAMLIVMADLRTFVQAGIDSKPFNNYPLIKVTLTNLVTSGSKASGYAGRAIDIITKYVAIPEVAGPTAQKIIGDIGGNLPISFTPFYNTVQGLKTEAVISSSDWSNLFARYGLSNSLLPWNKPKAKNDNRAIYSSVCENPSMAGWDAVSIYCDVLKSNDDPNCYGCKSPTVVKRPDQSWEEYLKGASVYEEVSTGLVWDWSRGIYAWGDQGAAPVTYTNFPLSSNSGTFTNLYSNIFRNPKCKGSFNPVQQTMEVVVGDPLTLQASMASGSSTVQTYIWMKNGSEIASGSSPIFTKMSFQESDIGDYWVIAVTSCGVRISSGHTMVTKKTLSSIYVDAAVTGGDGKSWAGALQKLEDALSIAGPNTTIHIAEGTYVAPNSAWTFELGEGMTLLGGYSHGGAERNPRRYMTVLTGGGWHATLTASNVNATVDGLVIRTIQSDASASAIEIIASEAKTLTVRNVRVVSAPGAYCRFAVYTTGASQLVMQDVTIDGVIGSNGLFYIAGASGNFTNVSFLNNEAGNGGLINTYGAGISMRNVLMANNTLKSSSDGVIRINSPSTIEASFLTIYGNTLPTLGSQPPPSITGSGTGAVKNSIVWDETSSAATSSPVTFVRSVAKGQPGAILPILDGLYRPVSGSSPKGIADPAEAGTFDLDGVIRPALPDAGARQGQ